jgi:hypothetical protein
MKWGETLGDRGQMDKSRDTQEETQSKEETQADVGGKTKREKNRGEKIMVTKQRWRHTTRDGGRGRRAYIVGSEPTRGGG